MICYEETELCLSVMGKKPFAESKTHISQSQVESKVSLFSNKINIQKSAHMNEKGNNPSALLLPSQPLKASIQLWHWFEGSEEDLIEFNSQLALEIEAFVAAGWEVRPIQRTEATYHSHQNFVPIEVFPSLL